MTRVPAVCEPAAHLAADAVMEYLINIANVLYLVAYFMRDIRWLRAFTIIAAGLLAAYFYFRPEPLMTAVYWNFFFGALNAYHLVRLGFEASGGSSRPCPNFAPIPQRHPSMRGALRPRGLVRAAEPACRSP